MIKTFTGLFQKCILGETDCNFSFIRGQAVHSRNTRHSNDLFVCPFHSLTEVNKHLLTTQRKTGTVSLLILKGHSQLAHIRVGYHQKHHYHFIANLHSF